MDQRSNDDDSAGPRHQPQQSRRFVRTFINSRYHRQDTSREEHRNIAEQQRQRVVQQTQSTPEEQQRPVTEGAETPGPSGTQRDREEQQPQKEQRDPRKKKENDATTAVTAPGGTTGLMLNNLPGDVFVLISEKMLEPRQTRVGTDFATMLQILAIKGYSTTLLADIHTVAVMDDYIVFIRSKGPKAAYIFQWRKREDWIALKIMATLRERGHWTCERIKIFSTRPRLAYGDNIPPERTTSVMHDHLAQLLIRFGATKEVKITECPFFWENDEVDSLRQLTTVLHDTPIVRGVPDKRWLPGGNWTRQHVYPMLLRRADACKLATRNYRWNSRELTDINEHIASYGLLDDFPSTDERKQNRFPHLDASQAVPTLQVYTWEWPKIYQKVSSRNAPSNFERIDITLKSQLAQSKLVEEALEDVHNALDENPKLQKLTLIVQTTDYKDELWENGNGEMLAAYVVTMLKTIRKVERECREPTARSRNRDIPTEIRLRVHADDWYTTEETIQATTATVQEALQRYIGPLQGTVTIATTTTGATITVEHLAITENCSLMATVAIDQLTYGQRHREYNEDRHCRAAILDDLEEFMRQDREEDI